MGVVYAAVDPQLNRKVAIKVVRDLGRDRAEIERACRSLDREARAAAGLSHPNVVTVYDSGQYGDGFYMAMELVEGHTLRRWLNLRRRRWTEIVEVFVEAGRGLHAAHATGLVHCDFKPDNVMVGADGRPQVADFGLVRWVEVRSELEYELSHSQTLEGYPDTQQSVIAGTPRYMAPEQRVGLPVGPRTDQFSFCVALYEALFGSLPFMRGKELPLEEPGTLGRAHIDAKTGIPRSIVRALLVGLDLSPERRHESMVDLVGKIERATTRQRRRKWWATGAFVAATTGVVGYSLAEDAIDPCEGAASVMDKAWNEDARKGVHERLSTSGTEAMAGRTTGLLDGYVDSWTAMRVESCEATNERGEQSAELFELRTVCLDRRYNALRSFVDRLRAGDEALARQAVSIAENMPPVAECDGEYIRAHKLVDAGATHNEKVRSLESWLAANRLHQRVDEAELLSAQGDPSAAIDELRQIETQAKESGLPYVRAAAINLRVGQQLLRGTGDGAIEELQQALSMAVGARDFTNAAYSVALMLHARRVGASDPVDIGMLLPLGRAWANNSVEPEIRNAILDLEESEMLASAGEFDDALHMLETRVDQLTNIGLAEHSMTLQLRSQRGKLLLDSDRPADAIEALSAILEQQRALLGPHNLAVSDTMANLGHAYRLQGNLEAARDHYVEAQRLFTESLGPRTLRSALVTSGLASLYQEQGDTAAARRAFEMSIEINQSLYGAKHVSLAPSLNQLAELEYEIGAYDSGLPHANDALEIIDGSLGPEHPYSAAFKITVGKLELAQGNTKDAVGTLTGAHEALFANDQLSPMWRAEAAFFLAQATLELDPTMRSEVDTLTRQSLAEYEKAQTDTAGTYQLAVKDWRNSHGFTDIASPTEK